ncbi:MAG TPA: carbohydrate-binding domain-containing protein, partial [Azospirillum sp.]|nr:carbohydrate-binding domain-containing protein [Azospirillum sp.]
MADLYVSTSGSDSNAGTKDSPFRTIQKASQVASAGTTVHVAPGTYEGGFQTTKSGTSSAPIRYVSDVKWGAKIVGDSSSGQEAWDNRGSNVVIDGFEVDGSGSSWLFGIYTAGSNSVVQNTKVHDIVRSSDAFSKASTGVGGAGIMGDSWTGGTNIKVLGNQVYNIGPNGSSSSLVHGVYMATSGQVQNNVIGNVVGDGITTWHDATNLKILNNTVFEARGAGVMIGAGGHYHSDGPNDYTQVSNNIIYDSAKGVEEYGEVGSHNTYTNNLVYANGSNWSLKNSSHSGTVSADPKFVKYVATGGGDYHLTSGSPAINAGTSSGAPSTDASGAARVGAVDIGAFEYGGTTAPPPAPTPTPTPTPSTAAAKIVVNAQGTAAAGVNAHFKVLIDGKQIGQGTAGTTAKDFTFSGTVSADAAHKVQIQYDNDAVINGQDRNLTVNKVTINGKAVLPTASNVSYDKFALDGKDVIAGQSVMKWGGTLIVSADKSYFPASAAAQQEIVVNAQGTAAAGVNAHFKVLIDGKQIGEGTAGTTAKDFTFKGNVSADAAHKVQIQYDNDAVINGQDRNLTVNKVTINGKAVLPTASNVSY